jgi:hypothetical protein
MVLDNRIVHIATREHFGNRMPDQLAYAQCALRGAGGGRMISGSVSCHGIQRSIRHGRACQRKSGLFDLRHSLSAEVGQARVPMPSTSCFVSMKEGVDARPKAGMTAERSP